MLVPMVSMAPNRAWLSWDEEIQATQLGEEEEKEREFSWDLLGDPKSAVLSCISPKILVHPMA